MFYLFNIYYIFILLCFPLFQCEKFSDNHRDYHLDSHLVIYSENTSLYSNYLSRSFLLFYSVLIKKFIYLILAKKNRLDVKMNIYE